MNTVCEVCGDIGFKHLLICCRDCTCSAVHQYCLEKVVFDASLADWVCYECLQKRGEVTCSRSLEIVSSERPQKRAHFDSTVHEPVILGVELSSSVELWTKMKSDMVKYKSLDKIFSSRSNASRKRPFNADHDNPSNELLQRNMIANVPQLFPLQDNALDNEMRGAPNDGCEKVLSCASTKNIPGVHETTVHSESSERFVGCQKGSFCHRGKTGNMARTFTSLEESGEDIPAEDRSLEPDHLQTPPRGDYILSRTSCVQIPPRGDYILSRTSCLSEAQKERVMAFIQETKPEITIFVSVIGKSSVQPPGPYLGISKDYALAYFPHESTKVTLQMPGTTKTWHPLFYKRNENRKNFLMGRWLDFVRDNNVQEGDICLLEPTKDERKSTFTVYLLRTSATHATGVDCFQRVGPYPCESIVKIASEVHIMEEPSTAKHVSSERVMHKISHDSSESDDSGDATLLPYIVPCRHDLSKSQKKIIEERVRAIRSEVPIYVTVMKNNNAGAAQRWMLELGVRYASEYLPAEGQTVVLQRMGKTWNTQMVIHNGRRWFLNGGWTKFARDNGLRVGDICLFELKKNEKLTMEVDIISKEQF